MPTLQTPPDDVTALTTFLQNTADHLDDEARRLRTKAAALNDFSEQPPASHLARLLAQNRQDLRRYYLDEARRQWNQASLFRERLAAIIREHDRGKNPVLLVLEKALWRIERSWYHGPKFYTTPDGPREDHDLNDFRYAIAWSLPAALAEPNPVSRRLEPHPEALKRVNETIQSEWWPEGLNDPNNPEVKDIHHLLWLTAEAARKEDANAKK